MIRIGMVGMGGISGAHLPAYEKLADIAQVVARCDKIPERADGTAKGVAINIGGPAATALQATAYTDYRELLADPEVDVVDICLPTDLHAEVAIAALQAGKHVLCEKPMALNVAQCDRMIAAAQASGSIFMIAQCIRFWPAYVYLKELVDSGKYGKLTSAQFSRLSGPPIWASENWLLTPERSGGSLLDLHIHDTDYLSFLLGTPTSVSTRGR
ncbi:MAG TPA: Gfo/Idh/MocA family oxidoreductase, partial [Armatimonadota bacterium]